MEFMYEGLGGSLDLNQEDVLLIEGNSIFGYTYKAESVMKLSGIGESLRRMTLPSKVIKFSLLFKGNIDDNLKSVQNCFLEDINQESPGKLSFNGSYVECYIVESSKNNPQRYTNAEVVEFVALVLTPLWITERRYDFSIHTQEESRDGFKLPMKFPMFFSRNITVPTIDNMKSTETLAEITFYGPAINPSILVGDTPYGIHGTLLNNERFIIDQRHKTVTKITESGDIINAFSMRQKTPSVFNPFPKGEHVIGYDGTFSLKIVLFEGSVEPTWRLS